MRPGEDPAEFPLLPALPAAPFAQSFFRGNWRS
jgi:hypothetical protein